MNKMGFKAFNLAIAFLLELCALAALAFWGFQTGSTTLIKVLLAIGAPLVVAVIWGRFMAPTSRTRLRGRAYLAVKIVIFGIAAIALAVAGQGTLAIIFAVIAIINQLMLPKTDQDSLMNTLDSRRS